jgi:hypothetical protein
MFCLHILTKSIVEAEAKRKSDIERRMHPKSAKDFELLYSELESWVQSKIRDMNTSLEMGEISESEKRKIMADILAKQTKALQTIDKLKNEAAARGREKRNLKLQEVMAKPKLWELSNGEVQEVHTQFTIRAAELMDLYQGLTDMSMAIDERLDILLNVKVGTLCLFSFVIICMCVSVCVFFSFVFLFPSIS